MHLRPFQHARASAAAAAGAGGRKRHENSTSSGIFGKENNIEIDEINHLISILNFLELDRATDPRGGQEVQPKTPQQLARR